MSSKNLDGIKIKKYRRPKVLTFHARRTAESFFVDAVRRKPAVSMAPRRPFYIAPMWNSARTGFYRQIVGQRVPLVTAVLLVIVAFTGGMWAALRTPTTLAEEQVQPVITEEKNSIPSLKDITASSTSDGIVKVSISLLQSYFGSSPTKLEALAKRKSKLEQFLKDRGSPLAGEAETIADQDHWKLILAISFAESTLGKNCYYFNCSGIGGSDIKTYKSLKNWILDFNRLLDRRYKGKSLEQMCGVYVQPCTTRWLHATGQVLSALEEQGIE